MKLVALAAAWIAGLLVGLEVNAYLPALVLFSVAAVTLGCLLASRGHSPWPLLLAVVALMGLIRVEVSEGSGPLRPTGGLQRITVQGLVVSDPEVSGPGVQFTLSVDAVLRDDGPQESRGRVLVFARPSRDLVLAREEPYFRYGDRLEITGRLEEPPHLGDFDYRTYLANQGIHAIVSYPEVRLVGEGGGNPALGVVYGMRRELSRGIDRALPETQASLAQTLLLGLRGAVT